MQPVVPFPSFPSFPLLSDRKLAAEAAPTSLRSAGGSAVQRVGVFACARHDLDAGEGRGERGVGRDRERYADTAEVGTARHEAGQRQLHRELLARLPLLERRGDVEVRSEEHTSELQSLMRISYAVFCLKKKNKKTTNTSLNTLTH